MGATSGVGTAYSSGASVLIPGSLQKYQKIQKSRNCLKVVFKLIN